MQRYHDDVIITLLTDVVPEDTETLYLSNAKKTPELARKHDKKGQYFDSGHIVGMNITQVGVASLDIANNRY